jgi:DNA polymerase
MNQTLWLDYETTSKADLTTNGLQRYVEDPTTGILCLGYAFGDDEPECWFPEDSHFPGAIVDHIKRGGVMVAHNATFDRLITEYVLTNDFNTPPTKLEQWRCSAARSMAHGLPAKLELACRAAGLPIQKQKEGTRLINKYSKHGRVPYEDDDKALMADYCKTDVAAMRQLCSILRELSDDEWAEYHRNERLNELGVPVDIEFATAALNYADDVKAEADGNIARLTGGVVKTARARKARNKWLFERITDKQKELLSVWKDKVKKYSFDQEHRANLLAAPDLDKDVEELINFTDDAGGSSTSKYSAMANTHVDGRVHGAITWHGAGTGRAASKGLQLHNFIRDAYDDPEPLIQDVLDDYELDHPAKTLAKLLRAAITSPEGISFGDWSAIEGRVCPWLSDDPRAQKVLDVFRNDQDLYIATADSMGLSDRQAGKVSALSLQFAGGAGALQRMAKKYGEVYTDEEAEHYKTLWRNGNKWCVDFWWKLHRAANDAYRNPGQEFFAGKISYFYDGGDWLWCLRPSGAFQAYFQPKIELVDYPWGEQGYELTALAGSTQPKAGKPWPRRTLTPGILIENVTQGTAGDLLRNCMMQAREDLPLIFTCHDEIIAEGDHQIELKTLMETLPHWAEGLPIAAGVKYQPRYGK